MAGLFAGLDRLVVAFAEEPLLGARCSSVAGLVFAVACLVAY